MLKIIKMELPNQNAQGLPSVIGMPSGPEVVRGPRMLSFGHEQSQLLTKLHCVPSPTKGWKTVKETDKCCPGMGLRILMFSCILNYLMILQASPNFNLYFVTRKVVTYEEKCISGIVGNCSKLYIVQYIVLFGFNLNLLFSCVDYLTY